MPEASTVEPSQDSDSIRSDSTSLREASRELTERRESNANREDPPDIISYRNNETGKRTDRRATVSREQAAKDLAGYRESKVLEAERQEQDLIRAHADALRSGRQSPIDAAQQQPNNQPQQFAPQGQAPTQASQPGELSAYDRQLVAGARDQQVRANVQFTKHAIEQKMQGLDQKISEAYSQGQPWQELGQEYQQLVQQHNDICFVDRAQMMMQQGLSPRVAAAVADREVLEWMQKATDGYEEAYRTVVERHEQNCWELIGSLEAVIAWMFPELIDSRDINGTIRAVRQANPKRADDIARWYAQFEQAVEVGKQARQRAEQEKRQKFQSWAQNQDSIFRARNKELMSPEAQKTAAFAAFEYLEEKGITKDETIKLHDEDILFRSAVGQEILWEAMQFRRIQNARETLPSKRYRAPVQVLKPGSAETHLEPRGEQLPASFSGRQSGLREAAAILSNRRAKRR
jgi:hypothetical protein